MKQKLNAWLDAPLSIRRCIKASVITSVVSIPLMYAWFAYEGLAPSPKEIVDEAKEKFEEIRNK